MIEAVKCRASSYLGIDDTVDDDDIYIYIYIHIYSALS